MFFTCAFVSDLKAKKKDTRDVMDMNKTWLKPRNVFFVFSSICVDAIWQPLLKSFPWCVFNCASMHHRQCNTKHYGVQIPHKATIEVKVSVQLSKCGRDWIVLGLRTIDQETITWKRGNDGTSAMGQELFQLDLSFHKNSITQTCACFITFVSKPWTQCATAFSIAVSYTHLTLPTICSV